MTDEEYFAEWEEKIAELVVEYNAIKDNPDKAKEAAELDDIIAEEVAMLKYEVSTAAANYKEDDFEDMCLGYVPIGESREDYCGYPKIRGNNYCTACTEQMAKDMQVNGTPVVTTMIGSWKISNVPDDIGYKIQLALEASGTTELIIPAVTTTTWVTKPSSEKKQQITIPLPFYEQGIKAALSLGIVVKVVPIIGFDFDKVTSDDERSMLVFTDKKITWDRYIHHAATKDIVLYGDMAPVKADNAVVLY